MLRPAFVLACSLACACGFRAQPPATGGTDPDAAPPDAAEADAPPADRVPCATPSTTGLVLCLELEDGVDDGRLLDSAPAHLDAATTGLRPAMRTRLAGGDSAAAQVMAGAVTRIPQAAALDRAAGYTSALWVRPASLPTPNQIQGLLDHELQWAMLIGHLPSEPVRVRCVNTGVAEFAFTEGLAMNAWSFVACTWDGSELCAYRWSGNTSERQCRTPDFPPAVIGAQGLAIGHLSEAGVAHSRFDGALDSVQLYDHALSADELCAILGTTADCFPTLR